MIDENLKDVVVAVATLLTPIVVYVFGQQAKRSADKTAVATQRVEATLATATAGTSKQLSEIHVLVNNRLTEALTKIERLEQRLYDETGEMPTGETPRAPT